MSASFRDIQRYVQRFINDETPETLRDIKDEINKEALRLSRERDWPELRTRLHDTFSVTSGLSYLALPGDCAQVISVVDTTNDIRYVNKSLSDLHRDNIATMDTNGRIDFYSVLGDYPIKKPLSAADTVRFTPSVALGAEIDIRIHGLKEDPEIPIKDTITTSTTVAQDTTVTFREGWSIHSIGTDGKVDTGHITITETTSGDTLGHIPIGKSNPKYHVLQFDNPPSNPDVLSVIYKRHITWLSDDDDVLGVPSMVGTLQDAVIARMKMRDRKYDQAGVHLGASRNELQALTSERDSQADTLQQIRPDFYGRRGRSGF